MRNRFRSPVLLFLLSLALAGSALADASPNDLNVDLSSPCPPAVCYTVPYAGTPGQYAYGDADFNPAGSPWSVNYQTALPLTWSYDPLSGNYNATFGPGGSFLIDGPDGLTFTGEITSGDAYQTGGPISYGVQLSYDGVWSNGLHGSGTFADEYSEQFGESATLTSQVSQTTPEPASLALFGSGLFAIVGWKRRWLQ